MANGAGDRAIEAFDKAQRRHLQMIRKVFYPGTITNKELCEKTGTEPLSIIATRQRWGLFKRVAFMDNATPAKKILWKYFNTNNGKRIGRGGPKLTIYTSLCKDLKLIGRSFKTKEDCESILLTLLNEEKGRDVMCEEIIREKLKSYERDYLPRQTNQER
jgi:hypothetical protein